MQGTALKAFALHLLRCGEAKASVLLISHQLTSSDGCLHFPERSELTDIPTDENSQPTRDHPVPQPGSPKLLCARIYEGTYYTLSTVAPSAALTQN